MNSNSSIGLCVLVNLILLCQGLNTAKTNLDRKSNSNGLGFGVGIGYPESEEENPQNQHILVRILLKKKKTKTKTTKKSDVLLHIVFWFHSIHLLQQLLSFV